MTWIRSKTDKYLPVLLHILGWCIYVSMVYVGNGYRAPLSSLILHHGVGISSQAIVFYVNFSYLLPFLYKKVRLPYWILANVLLITILSLIFVWVQNSFVIKTTSDNSFLFALFTRTINNVIFLIFAMIIRFSIDWFKQKYKENELENKTLKTELAFLKAQINPHFLFNALNNLYALTLKNSPEAPQSILQISKIMRYLLYETNDTQVQLSKEIDIIQDYIALQQLKSKVKTQEIFTISGDPESIRIEPLLILPLVENVFKHGVNPFSIKLYITNEEIILRTNNHRKTKQGMPQGIGLQNLKRRLDLLYPNQYQLDIDEKGSNFITEMTIRYKL